MNTQNNPQLSFQKKWANKKQDLQPKSISISSQELVDITYPQLGTTFPLVIRPQFPNLNLQVWAQNNQKLIEKNVLKYGGILFRDFDVNAPSDFEQFVNCICPQLMHYLEGATPRTKLSDKIYTSTEFPQEHSIALHNELSYVVTWPMKIWFCCIQPATQQGETPIADMRKVFQKISPQIQQHFIEKKWMLVRNFSDEFGLSWQKSFGTNDRASVENYCRQSHIEIEWKDNNSLRTHQIRPAVEKHPITKEMVWFNHIVFWHVSSLESQFRERFLSEFSEADLPYNTYYGDGTPIENSVLAEIRQAYQQETIVFPWQKGDILMLDNMLIAHGRNSYSGPRTVLTAMGEPFTRNLDS